MRTKLRTALIRSVTKLSLMTLVSAFVAMGLSGSLQAQCTSELSNNNTCNNGSNGIAFEITALRSMSLCKIKYGGTASGTVEVWAHPNGLSTYFSRAQGTNINDGLWFKVGTATVALQGNDPANYTEIPVDLSVLGVLPAGQKVGFVVFMSSGRYQTGVTPYVFSNGEISMDTEFWAVGGSTGPGNTTAFTTPNAPRQFCGSISYSLVTSPNDAGISDITSPLNFCAGNYPVKVNLRNFGTNQITSATINWTMNGVPQTPVNWTGLLDTMSLLTRTTEVTLASSYNFAAGMPYTIKAWTSLPNGQIDTVTMNDTTTATRKAAISGTLTIGPGGDYPNFTSAVNDLTLNGVCGPVVFQVVSGTYNEQFTIPAISGASAINTITFESMTGNASSVTVTYAASAAASNYVVSLSGADHVTFRNMTIQATGTTYASALTVNGGSDYNTFDGLRCIGVTTTSTSTNYAVIYGESGSIDINNTIKNCTVLNGSSGIYWYGSSTTSLEAGTVIENNTVTGFGYYGIILYYQNAPHIANNTLLTTSGYSTIYGLNAMYCDNQLRVLGNRVTMNCPGSTVYGMRIYYSDASAGQEGIVANNFITVNNGTSNYYAFYPYYSSNQKYYYNTVYSSSSYSGYLVYFYGGSNNEFKNNIFVNDGPGYGWYSGTNPAPISSSDYNVIYTASGNLAYWNGSARADLAALQAASGNDMNSISKMPNFVDVQNGDLHLAGASVDDAALHGLLMPDVMDDIDGDVRVIPYRGADEACFITKNTVSFEFTDANGAPTPYATVPGSVGVRYHVAFPEFDANIGITLRFYTEPGNQLVYTTSLSAVKQFGVILDGYQMISLGNLAPGLYRVEATFNTKNSCGGYQNYVPAARAFMAMSQGQAPCIVWPGDVNNDGLVNYGDRKSLTTYIQNANLSSLWLNGPKRFRADMTWDPLTAIRWEPQAATPWATPEGCYMDADGNGEVNSMDFIGIKMNWMRAHDVLTPKFSGEFTGLSFDVAQNYPNPFNPTTQIQFSVPEPSHVKIVVFDMAGHEVATIQDATVASGVHTCIFDATGLGSGIYTAIANIEGSETGATFTKSIRMNLTK